MARVTDAYVQERTDVILDAATRVFARKGVAVATMHDVAAEAGLSVGAIYRYYSGKDQLVRAVFDAISDDTRVLLAQASQQSEPPQQMLPEVARLLAERLQDEAGRDKIILAAEAVVANARRSGRLTAKERQVRDAYVSLAQRFFRQAQETGTLDPAIDAEALALLFVSLMVGLHVMSLESRDPLEVAPVVAVANEVFLRCAPRVDDGADESLDTTSVSVGRDG